MNTERKERCSIGGIIGNVRCTRGRNLDQSGRSELAPDPEITAPARAAVVLTWLEAMSPYLSRAPVHLEETWVVRYCPHPLVLSPSSAINLTLSISVPLQLLLFFFNLNVGDR